MVKKQAKHCITLYLRDPDDMETFAEARRLFPFFLNTSLSQFCLEAVRNKVLKLKGAPNNCIKCGSLIAKPGFTTCGIGRFDLCQKEKSK